MMLLAVDLTLHCFLIFLVVSYKSWLASVISYPMRISTGLFGNTKRVIIKLFIKPYLRRGNISFTKADFSFWAMLLSVVIFNIVVLFSLPLGLKDQSWLFSNAWNLVFLVLFMRVIYSICIWVSDEFNDYNRISSIVEIYFLTTFTNAAISIGALIFSNEINPSYMETSSSWKMVTFPVFFLASLWILVVHHKLSNDCYGLIRHTLKGNGLLLSDKLILLNESILVIFVFLNGSDNFLNFMSDDYGGSLFSLIIKIAFITTIVTTMARFSLNIGLPRLLSFFWFCKLPLLFIYAVYILMRGHDIVLL